MGLLQGFSQAPLGQSGVSPIYHKTGNYHPCALQMPKKLSIVSGGLQMQMYLGKSAVGCLLQ